MKRTSELLDLLGYVVFVISAAIFGTAVWLMVLR